nr:RNA-dependent RNA polymerase [Erysiphe necator associated negative-stranded RNA virus 1]
MADEHGQKNVPTTASSIVYERKFDIALRSTHGPIVQDKLRNVNNDSPLEIKILEAHRVKADISVDDLEINVNIYPKILNKILNGSASLHKFGGKDIAGVISRSLNIQCHNIFKTVQEDIKPNINKYVEDALENLRGSKHIANLAYAYSIFTTIIDKIPASDGYVVPKTAPDEEIQKLLHRSQYCWSYLGLSVRWSRNSCFLQFDSRWYLLPRSYLLMIHNKICDLMSILVLASSIPDKVYNCPILQTTTDFLNIWIDLAMTLDHRFFKVAKVLESLVIAETLRRIEGRGNSRFLQTLVEALREDELMEYDGSDLEDFMKGATIPALHEISCMSKLLGHPFCDMEQTSNDLYEKVHEIRQVDLRLVFHSVCQAKQEFVTQYIAKNNVWPPVHLGAGTPAVLREAQRKNVSPLQTSHQHRYGPLNIRAWATVTIQPIETFNRIENFLPYVKDRTVSLLRNRVFEQYIDPDPENPAKPPDWKETRALLAYLLLPYDSTEHLSYMELYSQENWEEMLNYLVIRLVPKEKELKESARCFGCKPPQERARTIVLGHNAATFLHKYTDSEAMTLSELTLSRKLHAFRNMYLAYRNFTPLIVCLDASSWNSRLRNEAMAPIAGQVLDAAHGTQMYRQFHETYHHTFVYLPDAQEVYHWTGQLGGIEGLDQYIWVHSYISHLKTILGQFGYPYQLLVKGDDARVIFLVPPADLERYSIDQIRERLVRGVTAEAARLGYLMKPEDSYGSQTYCCFSKNAFIRNVEQPQSFRKCQKAYGANNAFLNTLDDYVASSFSNCHSTSKTSPTPLSCYILALWWMLVSLKRDSQYKVLSESQLTALTLVPNLLGGFPIVYLHNFFQRAESDLLSSYCEMFMSCKQSDEEVYQVLENMWYQTVLDAKEHIEILCLDPYALPTYKPPSAQSILRRYLRSTISSLTQNHVIKELFECRKTDFQDTIMEILITCNTYNPKVMNILHSCSPEGMIMELLTKFESGKSVMDAIILRKNWRKGLKVLREAYAADRELNRWRISTLKGRVVGTTDMWIHGKVCGASTAQAMRERYWGKPIEGVTQPPAYHMVHIGTINEFFQDRTSDKRHFTVYWDPPSSGKEGSIFVEGKYPAFLGDSTGTGLSNPEVKLMTENVFAIKIAKLLDLYKWTLPYEDLREDRMSIAELCARMIFRYTNMPIQRFLPFAAERVRGRTTQHHLRANQFRPSIVPNTLQNVYTWIKVDMLSHCELANSLRHFRFNFHEIKCWITSVFASRPWIGDRPVKNGVYWAVTTKCSYCSTELVENTLHCTDRSLPKLELVSDIDEVRRTVHHIQEEVRQFSPELFLVQDPDDARVSRDIAARAICQHLLDTEWRESMRHDDTSTGHLISRAGRDVMKAFSGQVRTGLISFDDIRFIPMGLIVDAMMPLVVSDVLARYPQANLHNVGAMMALTPSNALPWTNLLYYLHNINRIRELQEHMADITGDTSQVLDNYESYAGRLGAQMMSYWYRVRDRNFHIVIMTNRADEEIRRSVKTRLESYRKMIFEVKYRDYRDIRGEDEARVASVDLIIAAMRFVLADPEYRITRGENGEVHRTEIPVISAEDIDDEMVGIRENLPLSHRFYNYLEHRWSNLPIRETWNAINEGNRNVFDMIEDRDAGVIRTFQRSRVILTKLDLVACKHKIKEFEPRQPAANPALEQTDNQMPELAYHCTGIHTAIRVINDHQMQRQLLPERIADLDRLVAVDMENRRVTGDTWVNRPIGMANISMSRYAFLLDQIGVRGLGEHRFIVCLADGYGGASRVMSQLCRSSRILFVTSPTASGEAPIPIGITANERNNVVLPHLITVGRWDLREESNFRAMENDYRYTVDLCLCDAEVIGENKEESYFKIWSYCSIYFLRNGRPTSLLILKMYLVFWRSILKIVALLRPRCIKVWLVKSHGSTWNQEVFLVASLSEVTVLGYDYPVNLYPTDLRVRQLITFWEQYNAAYTEEIRRADRVPLDVVYPGFIRRLVTHLPSYGWSQLETVMRTGLSMNLLRMRINEPELEYCRRMIALLDGMAVAGRREILYGEVTDQGHYHVLYSGTLTHAVEVLVKMMLLAGMKAVFSWKVQGERFITPELVYRGYTDEIMPFGFLHPNLGGPLAGHFTGRVLVLERNVYAYWTSGIRWGLAALNWGVQIPDV